MADTTDQHNALAVEMLSTLYPGSQFVVVIVRTHTDGEVLSTLDPSTLRAALTAVLKQIPETH